MQFTIRTPEEMAELGAKIAPHVQAGDVVALNGELGAGKTTLVRGLGAALHVRGSVTSPTFVLARTHPRESGAPLIHVDAYRLSNPAELDDLDLDFEGSIVVVEWASGMLDGLVDSWLEINIRPRSLSADFDLDDLDRASLEDAEPRHVTIRGFGPRFADFRLES